ncbi:MAG: cytochrome c oxidase subunit 4, partial [Dehalococcoidia bacterium]
MDDLRSDWNTPAPATTPPPTYWPLFLALAVVMMAYGIIFAWWFVGVGAVMFFAALAGWIGELRHDRRREIEGEQRAGAGGRG